jgi:hypothetical protein
MREANLLLLEAAKAFIDTQWPVTIRQCYYHLVSIQKITRDDTRRSNYKKLSKLLTDARVNGVIPWERIVDRSRNVYQPATWRNPAEWLSDPENYRRDPWQDQPNYVEVWCEKDTLAGTLEPITDEFAVYLRPMKGFNSASGFYEIAKELRTIDKLITVFYLGDLDPSGDHMDVDAVKRVREFGAEFRFERLAIFKEDIRIFRLPILPVNERDSRAKAFRRKFGKKAGCVEVDALPPAELRRRVRDAITDKIDDAAWQRNLEIEKAERAELTRFLDRFPKKE